MNRQLSLYAAQFALNFGNNVNVTLLSGKTYPVERIRVGHPVPDGQVYIMWHDGRWFQESIGPEENLVFSEGKVI